MKGLGKILLVSLVVVCGLQVGAKVVKGSDRSGRLRGGSKWFMGNWDSTINNLMEHPKTVALRIEVVDKETREPISNVDVSFEGEYWVASRTSFDEEGEREAQEMEYKVVCRTGSDGVVVGAFGWRKEYPWSFETDDVEKVQRIEIRHPRYKYVELRTPFYRFLDMGQKKTEPYPTREDTFQRINIVEKFEKTWPLECAKRDVKFFVLDLGVGYKGFDNKKSVKPEFFAKIRERKWSVVFGKPRNMMKWGRGSGRSWCGPYFVYLIEVRMERMRSRREYLGDNQGRESSSIERDDFISKPSDVEEESSQISSSSGEIKSWSEAKEIIERNLPEGIRAFFSMDNNKDDTELGWQIKRGTWTLYEVKVPKNMEVDHYSMGFSYSGNIVKISHQNPKPSKLIMVTPTNSKGQMLDDQYPTSVNLYASSERGAREITKALIYLESLDCE